MTGIYAIVNQLTGRRYVGRSANTEKRWKEHRSALRSGRHYNADLQQDWISHGEDAFQFIILEVIDDFEDCRKREWWHLQNSANLYNLSPWTNSGPRPGYKPAPWIGAKVSAALKGRPKTAIARQRLSTARTGMKVPKQSAAMTGRRVSSETKRKMSETHKRRYSANPRSAETCAKLSEALTGRPITWGDKISAAKKGKTQPPEVVAARMAGMKAARERRAKEQA